jgi:arginine exporter protein ArgO
MAPALGICTGNLLWIVLAVSGVAALAHVFPQAFLVLKLVGICFIMWIAWRMAVGGAIDLARAAPPPRRHMFARGVGLQLANPNALVFFGGTPGTYKVYLDNLRICHADGSKTALWTDHSQTRARNIEDSAAFKDVDVRTITLSDADARL